MAWSEYRHGKWLPKQVTAADQALAIAGARPPEMDVEIRGDDLTIVFARFISIRSVLRLGNMTFRNYNGLVEPTKVPVWGVTYDRGFVPIGKTTLEFLSIAGLYAPMTVFRRIPHAGEIRFLPPQENLWVNFGSGRAPSVWYNATSSP